MDNFHFVPFFRLPLTDLLSNIYSHQEFGACPKLEMKAMNCLEAYGVYKGKEACKDLIHDYRECFFNTLQAKRVLAMAKERDRQYSAGERAKHYMDDVPSNSFSSY